MAKLPQSHQFRRRLSQNLLPGKRANSTFIDSSSDLIHHQAIPNELVLRVLQLLGDEMLQQRYMWYSPRFIKLPSSPPDIYTNAAATCRRALLNSVLTCRGWYLMGVESLYVEPQLRHKRQLRSFALAVEGSPLLANTVKALSLSSYTYPKFVFDFFGVAARNRERCKGYISRIFAACHSIERVDFALDVVLGNAVVASLKITDPSPTTNLRQLTIRGGSFLGVLPNLDLPNLEVLCVSQHFHFGEFTLPHLPRLHTLQIVGIFTVVPLHFDESKLPSLRVLQLFSGTYEAPVIDLDDCPSFPNLERLELLGSEEVIFFPPIQASTILQTIKALVLGPLGADTEWLSTWRIPKTLESLVVYLDLSDGEAVSDKVLQNLSRCLSSSYDKSPKWSLTQLSILTQPDGLTTAFDAGAIQLPLDLLRLMCIGWGVSLDFGEIDMTAWVVDKCSHPIFMSVDGATLPFTLFDERSPIRSVTPISRGPTAPSSVEGS